jgi:hypothetical protein
MLNLEIEDSSKQVSKAQILSHKIFLMKETRRIVLFVETNTLGIKYRIYVILSQIRHTLSTTH